MFQFADEAVIEVHSGKGGNGCIAFRREKYIPHGGPNGGDGGKGGNVIFVVKRNMRTLSKLRHHHIFKARNGADGQGWNRFGKDGEDVVIPVPPGTSIRDVCTNELIHDFTGEDENKEFLFLEGGKGGWGNVHFKTSTNQAPRYAHPGAPGEERTVKLELTIIADVGLVGFPNAGKSSLLTAFTNARPKIAPYPFGKDGEDVVIPVPPGTSIRDVCTNELIHDFTGEDENKEFLFLEGGKGGWGNVHFKTSTNQAPRYAHPGAPGEERTVKLELTIIADVGLVGFPNAGKSSLLTAFTNARPKIAPYPFTTKIPNLGVLRVDDEQDIIIADIPGIIEGASEGVGLGFDFLKHISRTACLLFMIDCSDENYLTAYDTLLEELGNYSAGLLSKPRIVLANKIDVEGAECNAAQVVSSINEKEPETKVIPVSVQNGIGMGTAKKAIIELVNRLEGNSSGEKTESGILKSPDFMQSDDFDEENVQYPGSER